ncbi:MAG: pitrilysin family protein [Rhodospirillaceae bacterium]
MSLRALFRCAVIVPALLLLPLTAQAIEAQKVVSDGGIEAWLVEDHSVPVIALEVGFQGGAALDPADKPGLANMVSALLDEGAGDLDSLAFQSKLESLAIGLSFGASQDNFTGSLRTVLENRDTAFDMLRMALTQPRFDEEPVSRIRSQIQTALSFDLQRPNTIAARRWNEVVFGTHPYARPVRGTPESIAAITTNDLRTFVTTRLGRDRMKIGVAGSISPAELKPLLDATFGGLPKQTAVPPVPDATPAAKGTVEVIDKAIPQSVAVFGHPGVERHHPDFYPAFVVNHILGGGGFTARLMQEVREKRGLAYSVSSSLAAMDHAALVTGGVGTNNARMKESLDLIRAEWARMAENGPTAEELEDAKTYLMGAWPLRFTSTPNVASILASMQLDGYPIDHLQTRNDKVAAVTLEDARRVAASLLKPDALTIVVVGQPEGIQEASR